MKWMQWMLQVALTAIVTSLCAVLLTFATVNTYVNLLLDQYHIPRPAGQAVSLGQLMSGLSQQLGGLAFGAKADGGRDGALRQSAPAADGAGAAGGAAGSAAPGEDRSVAVSGVPTGKDTGAPGVAGGAGSAASGAGSAAGSAGSAGGAASPGTSPGAGAQPPAATDKQPPEDAVAVWSRQSSGAAAGSASADSQKVVVSGEEFTRKKEQLSAETKASIFSLLTSRVPESEIQTISLLMEDGITSAELKELETILKKYLKPEEYARLLDLIKAP